MIRYRGILALLIVILALPLWGKQYFLSPEGNDRNPGTLQKPWKSLAKAGSRLKPGDQLAILDGTYTETLSLRIPFAPSSRGQQPVYIFAVHPGKVILRPPAGAPAIRMDQVWFAEISGLRLSGEDGGTGMVCRDSERLVFRYMDMCAPGEMDDIHTAIFLHCQLSNSGKNTSRWQIRNCSDLLWKNCTFSGKDHSIVFSGKGSGNTFHLCLFENGTSGPELQSGPVELFLHQCSWTKAHPHSSLWKSPFVLFRRNILFSGGFPAKPEIIQARSTHNTIFGKRPQKMPENSVNDLFLTNKKNLRWGLHTLRLNLTHSAVDTGKAITHVRGNVSGSNVLPVNNAGFFIPQGLTRLQIPDTIWIGDSRLPARIIRVEPEKNLLYLDRAVEAENNMPILFPAHGTAPDPGCNELGMEYFQTAPGCRTNLPRQNSFRSIDTVANDIFIRPEKKH
ncbi:MAG: hypothetical protein IJV89_09760 [Lentisphaeria bacterium]|nr:hypothetical protein [Lentisphaeria bacterium]